MIMSSAIRQKGMFAFRVCNSVLRRGDIFSQGIEKFSIRLLSNFVAEDGWAAGHDISERMLELEP